MQTFSISLRTFKHPLTLLSIGLLLLNDHVLKAAVPSWLTGKLSDFAGLFFFPFLLAAMLAFPLESLRLPPRRIMALSCAVTALWFTLIKTAPFANEATEALVSWLVGGPTQIVLDPTDLIALPMIGLAYYLWERIENVASSQGLLPWPDLTAFIVLGIGALATTATSCAASPFKSVGKVAVINNTIYATYGYSADFSSLDRKESPLNIIESRDFGQTWTIVKNAPQEVAEALNGKPQWDKTVCDPASGQLCYRISEKPQIEESLDGGQTWRTAWVLPQGRSDFQYRVTHPDSSFCSTAGTQQFPIEITMSPDNDGYIVVASMGVSGVLMHQSQGAWEQLSVLEAKLVPTKATTLIDAISLTSYETIIFAGAALLSMFGLSAHSWQRLTNTTIDRGALVLPVLWLAIATVGAASDSLHTGFMYPAMLALNIFPYTNYIALLLLLIIVFLISWQWNRIGRKTGRQETASRAARACWLATTQIFLLPSLVFLFWAFGIISLYLIAWFIAVALMIVVLIRGFRQIEGIFQ